MVHGQQNIKFWISLRDLQKLEQKAKNCIELRVECVE
jgi:hypothetical protein